MESPPTWEFMKKLSVSPWAPVMRLIEDADVLGSYNSFNLREELEDCAVVVEDVPGPIPKTDFCDSDDSDSAPRYRPSSSDSDDSLIILEEIKSRKLVESVQNEPQLAKPCVKSDVVLSRGDWRTKPIPYNGQLLELKDLRIVLVDLNSMMNLVKSEPEPTIHSESSDSECIVVDDSDEEKNSVTQAPKRPPVSWGVNSIQELKKRKLGPTPRPHQGRPIPNRLKSRTTIAPKTPQTTSNPSNPFGLNAWRLALADQELRRLHELSQRLQKEHLSLESQKSIAYKFKYGLNEVSRLVTKKSLNSIVAEQKQLGAPSGEIVPYHAPPETGHSKEFSGDVNTYLPTVVQGVAAGFMNVFDRLERLEAKCNEIMDSKAKSIDLDKVD